MTFILSVLFLASSSVFTFLFAFDGWVVHVPLIVAVHLALHRSFAEGAIVVLLITYLADLSTVGPPGLLQLTMTLLFFAAFLLSKRFGGRPMLTGIILCFAGSLLADLILALLFKLHYPTLDPFQIFLSTAWLTATATTLCFIPHELLLRSLESSWQRRTKRHISLGD